MAVSGPDGAVDHVRIARLAAIEQRIRIHRGDDLIVTADLTAADPMAEPVRIGYSLPEVLDRVQVGDRVYFDDGEFGGRVIAKTTGGLRVQIDQIDDAGAWLRAEKGINLPDSDLGLSGLTEDDRAVLPFIVEHADGVEMSFVNTADDLAVEAGFARMGELQEEIMWLCEAAHVPVIWVRRSRAHTRHLGHPGTGEPGEVRTPVSRRGDRRRTISAFRGRDAEQGAVSPGCGELPGPPADPDVRPPRQEEPATAAAPAGRRQ